MGNLSKSLTQSKPRLQIITFLILLLLIFLSVSNVHGISNEKNNPVKNHDLNTGQFFRLYQYDSITELNSTISITSDLELEITDEFTYFNSKTNDSSRLNIYLNGQITSVSVKANVSIKTSILPSETNSTIQLTITENNWNFSLISLSYGLKNVIMPLGDGYILSYGLPLLATTISYVDLALPPHSIIIHKKIAGKETPIVSPTPTYNYTDGTQSHLRWEPANSLKNQPIVIEFSLEPVNEFKLTTDIIIAFFIGLLTGMLLITSIIYIFKYLTTKRNAKSTNPPASDKKELVLQQSIEKENSSPIKVINLTDQERKIIYALMSLDMKASQETLRKELGWGKSKLSTYLKRLEGKGIITQKEVGRQKIVYLLAPVEM